VPDLCNQAFVGLRRGCSDLILNQPKFQNYIRVPIIGTDIANQFRKLADLSLCPTTVFAVNPEAKLTYPVNEST
ncbi:MAG: hypothetical protein ACPGTU_20330, partial [Myxococcota bacterium]